MNMCKSNCNYADPPVNFRVVSVLNYGAFVASAEIYYDYQGTTYNFYNFNLAVLQEFKVNVPFEATNVVLYVWVDDLFRGQYLLFKNTYPVADDACFLLWGLSFAAQYKPIPCTSPGLIQSLLPAGAIFPMEALDNASLSVSVDPKSNNVCKRPIKNCCKCNTQCCKNNNRNIERVKVDSTNIYG